MAKSIYKSPSDFHHFQELQDTVEDVSQHRDAALRKVKTLEARKAMSSWRFMVIYRHFVVI